MKMTAPKYLLLSLFACLALIGGYLIYQHQQRYPTTDDAYIQANVVNVAAQINAQVLSVNIRDQDKVHAGQTLVVLDPTAFKIALHAAESKLMLTRQNIRALQAAVASANATLAARRADLAAAKKDDQRIRTLVAQGLYPIAQGDASQRRLLVAMSAVDIAKSQRKRAIETLGQPNAGNAAIQAAQAAVDQARDRLRHTVIKAPVSGTITQLTLRPGATTTAYQPLFAIVDTQHWWASANFKETQLQHIRPGQSAKIVIDMYPSTTFIGKVKSIAPGSGAAFALLPPENATGNWVKVTQRFPVLVSLPLTAAQINAHPQRIGASCSVRIDTQSTPP